MRILWSIILALASLAIVPADGYGQVNSPGARTLFARRFLYRSDWRVIRISKLFNEGKEASDPLGQKVSVVAWENFLVYGLPHNLTAIGILPVLTRNISVISEGRESSSRDTGLADPVLLLQYDGLYRKNRPGSFTRLAGFFGVKPPWGEPAFSTGTTDFLQGLIFTHATLRWFLNGDFQWVATTERNGLEEGDVFQYDASVMYRLLTYPEWRDLFLVLEVNGFSEQRARRAGMRLADTGGNTVFLSPGIEFFIKPNLALEFSFQIPVHQGLNGTQLGRNFVLATGFRLVY